MKIIKAEQWNVCVCNSTMDSIHGNYYLINEFYIPKYNIAFNIFSDNLNVFVTDKGRYKGRYDEKSDNNRPPSKKIRNVNIPESLAESLKMYLELKNTITNHTMKFLIDNKNEKTKTRS